MALFDKFRKLLTPEEKRKKKVCPVEKYDPERRNASAADEGQMLAAQSGKQVRVSQLTPREQDLYLLLLEGFTLKESAKQLGVKYSTANTHMSSIYKKLEVSSRAELIISYRNFNGGNYDE